MIIIPDIHGRSFWKDAINQVQENEEIVFLGDYLDPYAWENISPEAAIENFKEIIEYAYAHDNVTLLLGNHDLMTYISPNMGACRTDFVNKDLISSLFKDNYALFQMGKVSNINNKVYTFTHSVILPAWLDYPGIRMIIGDETNSPESIIEWMNEKWAIGDIKSLERVLHCVSRYRGGWGRAGSCVWADIHEIDCLYMFGDVYQIFGHSQQERLPIIAPEYACLDCRQAFRLHNDGKIEAITPENVISYY